MATSTETSNLAELTEQTDKLNVKSDTPAYRANLANDLIPDDVAQRRIFHIRNGSRYVNFSCIDRLTAMTWENEFSHYYLGRAYQRGRVNCYHPMIVSLYNQVLAGLWVIKINVECGTATADETEFWNTAVRIINFESLSVHPQLFALLSTIQPHTPKDDRFGKIVPKMWTDIRNHPLDPNNHHLADGIYKYLNPDYFGIMSGCRRMSEGISFNEGAADYNFFWNLDATDARPAVAGAALPQAGLNQAVGSPRLREFGLIPGYATYKPTDCLQFNVIDRRSLMHYFRELYLPQPDATGTLNTITEMFFLQNGAKWITNLARHMVHALSFYKEQHVFADLKVVDDSNIGLEMINLRVPQFKQDFDGDAFPANAVPANLQADEDFIAAAPATHAQLNDFVTNHPAHIVHKPDYLWALRVRTQHAQEMCEHEIYAREKDIPMQHRKDAFIYDVYAPKQTLDHYIGYDETSEGDFYDNDHNPRRYIYSSEEPQARMKQVLQAKMFTRSQDMKDSPFHK